MYDTQMTFLRGALDLPAATTYTDVIKMGKQDVSAEARLYGQVTTAATSGGSATTQFILQKDDNEAFASATTVVGTDTGAIAVATLVDDYVFYNILLDGLAWQEAAGSDTWLRVAMITAVAALTAGEVYLGIIGTRPKNIV